eukprot:1246059-Alexandrium_andersonii.AAC.1
MRTRFGMKLARERELLLSLQPGLVQPTGAVSGSAAPTASSTVAGLAAAAPGPDMPTRGNADAAATLGP